MPKDKLSNQFLLTAHQCSSQFFWDIFLPQTCFCLLNIPYPMLRFLLIVNNFYFSAKKQLPGDPSKKKTNKTSKYINLSFLWEKLTEADLDVPFSMKSWLYFQQTNRKKTPVSSGNFRLRQTPMHGKFRQRLKSRQNPTERKALSYDRKHWAIVMGGIATALLIK